MTTLATRIREIGAVEKFEIEVLTAEGKAEDLKKNGFDVYNHARAAKGSMTVTDWKTGRFKKKYPAYDCNVLFENGEIAHGNTTLAKVRSSYEEENGD